MILVIHYTCTILINYKGHDTLSKKEDPGQYYIMNAFLSIKFEIPK